MTKQIESPPRKLVVFTVLILVIGTIFAYLYLPYLTPPVTIDTAEQPTIGSQEASVHIVVFEEPLCGDCRRYQQEIFPSLNEEFIKKGQVRYTLIPLSFLSGSMPICIALLCVYYQGIEQANPELFFDYFDYLGKQPLEDLKKMDRLIAFAQETSSEIDLNRLKKSLETQEYQQVIEDNTKYAKKVMRKGVVTPTIYVNGIRVEHLTLEHITKLINHSLGSLDA